MTTLDILKTAKETAPFLLTVSAEDKNRALSLMADSLVENTEKIIEANSRDMENARGFPRRLRFRQLQIQIQSAR